jgi:hypothetical protein
MNADSVILQMLIELKAQVLQLQEQVNRMKAEKNEVQTPSEG